MADPELTAPRPDSKTPAGAISGARQWRGDCPDRRLAHKRAPQGKGSINSAPEPPPPEGRRRTLHAEDAQR